MRYAAIVLLALGACNTTPKEPPTGKSSMTPHPEFAKIRPTVIVLMRVHAPRRQIREHLRKEVYDRLFEKGYSCLKLETVDAHTDSGGTFDGTGLDWDATITVNVTDWKPFRGSSRYLAAGGAKMVHQTGEVLWEFSFSDWLFEVESSASETDYSFAMKEMSHLITGELPAHPPLPRG
jgi:hypothetical protein